jgi:F-type H+-transporting ATPase subunit b
MMSRIRSIFAALLLAASFVAAAPAPARAAHAEAPEGKNVPKGEAANDIFAPRLDLTIWTIIVFVGLLLVLRRFAWKPMLQGLQGRENRIRGALDEAQTARDEAHKLRDQFQAEMAKLSEKIREAMDEARREGQQTKERMVSEGKTEIQAESERRRREIQVEAEQAKRELWNQTAQLVTLVSAQVIGRNINADDHRNLVEQAIAELRGAPAQTRT